MDIPPMFAFEAETWEPCVGKPVFLSKVFRQKDEGASFVSQKHSPLTQARAEFVEMLNQMRFGQ